MTTAYLTHPACERHEMTAAHPESPQRIVAIETQLVAQGVMSELQPHEAPQASLAQLARVHSQRHIESIQKKSPLQGLTYVDGDTSMNPYSLDAALFAAGAVVKATELVVTGQCHNAFCNIRPPGHHAERDRAMGFCLFNNIAVGAACALEDHGLKRIAIGDFDVHHGNGTEDIFRHDSRVLFCSSFQHPFYPFSEPKSNSPTMIKVPLAAGSRGAEFRQAILKYWVPAIDRFEPEMIFISAGFDAHAEDPLASLELTEPDYIWVTELMIGLANQYSKGRIVSVLEGGYALAVLGRSAAAHITTLLNA